MVLEVVEVDVDLEKGVRRYDCFDIRDIACRVLFEFTLCLSLFDLCEFALSCLGGLSLISFYRRVLLDD